MRRLILIPLSIAALFASGCSTPAESNPPAAGAGSSTPTKTGLTAFEGSWIGRDLTPGQEGPATLNVSGQNIEFHGTDANDWLKGTFTLREDTTPKQFVGIVSECGAPEYAGKYCYAIYKIEDGALTVAGYEPGITNFPRAFDAPDARELVFKHSQ